MNKIKIINEIKEHYPFLIQNIESSAPIEEMLNMIESQSFPESSDFQGFFVAYFGLKGYKFIHNSKFITLNHLRKIEKITEDMKENITDYNIVNDLLQIDIDDIYLIFKIYFDKSVNSGDRKILAIGHVLKKNLNTRLLMLDQKQNNKLIDG